MLSHMLRLPTHIYRPLQRTSITWKREFITDLKFRRFENFSRFENFTIVVQETWYQDAKKITYKI